MKRRTAWIVALIVLGTGCSAESPDAGASGPGSAGSGTQPAGTGGSPATGAAAGTGGATQSVTDPTDPMPSIGGSGGAAGAGSGAGGAAAPAADCQGFSFDKLVYSPGGNVLPNTCEPFHPTTNNPYAVRCIDAWPWYETSFPGDEFCILPPPPDKGVQFGVHPQGKQWFAQVSTGDMSGYDSPSDDFTMQDGEEEERNYHTSADNAQAANFYRGYARMRPGSHHMINSTAAAGGAQEVWGPGSADGLFMGTTIPGAQRPDENAPKSLDKPAEDAGLYSMFPAAPGVTFNMHHFNASGGPILKEAWVNVWWEDDATIRVYLINGLDLAQRFTLSVPPGTTQDLHYSWNITQPIRMVSAFGHRHAWTTNFSSWVEAPGGELDIIYQSFDWFDEPTYRYDSITQNPVPAPDTRSDGGSSGLRMLNPGEKLHFNCHIAYTDARAAAVGAPTPASNGNLGFANEAFTAEMCILFGYTAGVALGAPVADASALPDFATID